MLHTKSMMIALVATGLLSLSTWATADAVSDKESIDEGKASRVTSKASEHVRGERAQRFEQRMDNVKSDKKHATSDKKQIKQTEGTDARGNLEGREAGLKDKMGTAATDKGTMKADMKETKGTDVQTRYDAR